MATYRNFAIVAAIVIVAFYQTLVDLMGNWLKFDESQSHGLIIIALFIHLFTGQLKTITVAAGDAKLVSLNGP